MKANYILLVASLLATFANCQRPQARDIPGTDLKTRTFYRLGLQPFPNRDVTWTVKTNSTYNFVTIDGSPPEPPRNTPDNDVYSQDYLWEFIPVDFYGRETGWYGLKNRGRQSAYLTYGQLYLNQQGHQSWFVVLGGFSEDRKQSFFLKPVKAQYEGKTYYQPKFRDYENATVTWAEHKYGRDARYLQLDNSARRVDCYKEGGGWHKHTLFSFQDSAVVEKADEEQLGYP